MNDPVPTPTLTFIITVNVSRLISLAKGQINSLQKKVTLSSTLTRNILLKMYIHTGNIKITIYIFEGDFP